MDEETMKNEFFEWLENVFEPRFRSEKRLRWNDCSVEAWLAATRRADKRAREEIIELLKPIPIGKRGQDDALMRAIRIIRATIKEE